MWNTQILPYYYSKKRNATYICPPTCNVGKDIEMKNERLKWEKLGGKKKVSMRIHQYEREHLERIVSLGTCPLARGALASTARTISYVALISCYWFSPTVLTHVGSNRRTFWYKINRRYMQDFAWLLSVENMSNHDGNKCDIYVLQWCHLVTTLDTCARLSRFPVLLNYGVVIGMVAFTLWGLSWTDYTLTCCWPLLSG